MSAEAWLGRTQFLPPSMDPRLLDNTGTAALLAAEARNQQTLGQLAANTLSEMGATRRTEMVLKDAAAARADALRKGRRDLAVSMLGSGDGLGALTRPAGRRLGVKDIGFVNPIDLLNSASQFQDLLRQVADVSGETNPRMAPVWAAMGQMGTGAS